MHDLVLVFLLCVDVRILNASNFLAPALILDPYDLPLCVFPGLYCDFLWAACKDPKSLSIRQGTGTPWNGLTRKEDLTMLESTVPFWSRSCVSLRGVLYLVTTCMVGKFGGKSSHASPCQACQATSDFDPASSQSHLVYARIAGIGITAPRRIMRADRPRCCCSLA